MKRENVISAIILLAVLAGCGGNKQSTSDLITVDVTKSYPKKELLLQDIFDVEYVHLDDTQDEFLTQGIVHDVGEKFMLVRNLGIAGDILVFDRQGKAVSTFNRRGQGPEEYTSMAGLTLDEDTKEIFVVADQKIVVYDLFGVECRVKSGDYAAKTQEVTKGFKKATRRSDLCAVFFVSLC